MVEAYNNTGKVDGLGKPQKVFPIHNCGLMGKPDFTQVSTSCEKNAAEIRVLNSFLWVSVENKPIQARYQQETHSLLKRIDFGLNVENLSIGIGSHFQ